MRLFERIFDAAIDMHLCRGNGDIWLRHRFANFLLGAANFAFIWILITSIRSVRVVGIIIGAIGTLYFCIVDLRYTVWWIREGRYGFDPPWFELLTFQKV